MTPKLYATDLDGTLIADDGTVSQANIDAMHRAVKKGIYTVPTTGRCFYEMPEILRDEKPFTHCICSNGAVIFDRDGKSLWESNFSVSDTKKIVAKLREFDTLIEIYTDGAPYTEQKYLNTQSYEYFRIEENYHAVMNETRRGIDSIEEFLNPRTKGVEMFNVYFHDAAERERAFAEIRNMNIGELTTSMQSNMEILQPGVNKGFALNALAKMLDIKKSEIVAAGDSRNDLSMFSAAGICLAVSNACDDLKALATDVICSNNDGSAHYALTNYFKD